MIMAQFNCFLHIFVAGEYKNQEHDEISIQTIMQPKTKKVQTENLYLSNGVRDRT